MKEIVHVAQPIEAMVAEPVQTVIRKVDGCEIRSRENPNN